MWNTYYHLVFEQEYPEGDDYTLYDSDCEPLADVSSEFFFDLCDEGAGILRDGRLINNETICDCAPECQWGYAFCYAVLDRDQYPWGIGSIDNPVTPLRSWAVDNDLIAFGTVLYSADWDGVYIPEADGLGGFVHDGCFRADDADSNRVTGNHYDFYAGTKNMVEVLNGIVPDSSVVTVYKNPPQCSYLAP